MSFFPWQCQKKIKYSILDIFHHICAYTSTVCFFYFPAMIICLVGYQGKRRGSVIWLLHHDMAVYMTRTWYTYANQKLSSWWNHIGVSHCINRHAFQLSSLLGSSACNVNPLPSVRLKKNSAQCISISMTTTAHACDDCDVITDRTHLPETCMHIFQGCISATCPCIPGSAWIRCIVSPFPRDNN